MQIIRKIFYYSFFAGLLITGCKEKYDPPIVSPDTGYLVIEGSVNSGMGSTTIILSRTTKLDNRSIQYELGATVQIEGEDNSTYTLFENEAGHYRTGDLNLNTAIKYRIHVFTNTGKEYQSDFVVIKNSPPIDSISWKRENDGVQLYINTHDPSNNTRYYQWEYAETWEFHSAYQSILKLKITPSTPGDIYSAVYKDSTDLAKNIFTCYKNSSSTNLLLGSSAKLSNDVIFLPINFIEPGSQKLSVLYSFDVIQYGWTKEGYEFLERMKKNTEGTGSVFDAQPSEINGNIRCLSDPAEPVIGFFNVSAAQEKRIFIARSQVPDWNYQAGCFQLEIDNVSDSIVQKALGYLFTNPTLTGSGQSILKFNIAEPGCVDCTLSGSNIKPSFWP